MKDTIREPAGYANRVSRPRDKIQNLPPKDIKDLLERLRRMARAVFWLNVCFFVICVVICGASIYLLSDRIIILYMLDNNLLMVSCWILIISSGLMIIVAILGGLAALLLNRHLLFIYAGFVSLIILALILTGIMALNMQLQFGDWAATSMSETLKQYYGVDQDLEYNQHVTRAWDQGQTYMSCCGVSGDYSWEIYRSARWYIDRPGFENILYQNDPTVKFFVPASCCVQDDAGYYVNLTKCQQFEEGPPARREGEFNEGLKYKSCYSAITDWMYKYSSWLAGLGLGAGLFMVSGLVLTVYILITLPTCRRLT